MNKKQRLIVIIAFLIFEISNLKAQETVITTGGNITGSGGSISYSIGQVLYCTNEGVNGDYVIEGVQQAYEISVVTGILEAKNINLVMSVYPNPTIDYLTVKVENYETKNLRYVLVDINGKVIQTIIATGQKTKIETNNLLPENYFVKVLDNQNEIKIFKFIKTN